MANEYAFPSYDMQEYVNNHGIDWRRAVSDAIPVTANQQQTQIPTAEQAVNAATLDGAAQDKAQYQAAQQEAMRQNMAALSNLFADYSRPSDDVYNDTYNQLVMNGIYGDEAHKLASRKASEYSANRLARLQMGMQADGVTPDGYITDNGMYYLTQMQVEDPAVASLYSQGYANMPKVAYDRQWDIAKGDHGAARQYQYREQGANADLDRRKNYYNWQKEQELQMLAQQADYAAKATMASAYQDAIGLGKSPEEAKQYAESQGQIAYWSILGGYNGGGRGSNGRNGGTRSGNNGGKEEKLTAAQQKSLNSFQNMFTVAMDMIENGTQEESGDAIDNLWNSVVEMRDKGEIDPDTYEEMYGYVEHLNKLRDRKYYGR